MTDKFFPIPVEQLLQIILADLENGHIFHISKSLFFSPKDTDAFKLNRFGVQIDTPIGVAAGPHTQMAQNIISAWLCGARYMELKTIQTLDELEISKPCIDMYDEGYNCEWSQELKIKQSFEEYLKAWIIIHILNHKFGFASNNNIHTIFNMSVGYNLEGIQKDNVQWFLAKMQNCETEKNQMLAKLEKLYPQLRDIKIPSCISDNVTLSTMHGCPPDEIEKIARYLLEEKKLHTIVKLNPTLLGATELRKILNELNKFKTIVPDIAFEHDLKYNDAIKIIQSLSQVAKQNHLEFGLKLTNTLESVNNRKVFPEKESMMYMSGRALHPISIHVAKKLQEDFQGKLDISFSAGADCFNIKDLLTCKLYPVTVCTDILKPGGYGRLIQYIENLRLYEKSNNIKHIDEYISNNSSNIENSALENLKKYASEVLQDNAYKKTLFDQKNIKTSRKLDYFDCIQAPCAATCPTNQDIPSYLYHVANNDFEKAWQVILQTNPLPSVLGMVCDHTCQTKCTRSNYDESIHIRAIKRFVVENALKSNEQKIVASNNLKVAIIGAGPSGLAAAYYLKVAGFYVDVFENNAVAGGMVNDAIPQFRLSADALKADIARIESIGVNIHYNSLIDKAKFNELQANYNYIYIAVGAKRFKQLGIEGENVDGVLNPLTFLKAAKTKQAISLGDRVAIVGGGNTAMDIARTAWRMLPKNAKIVVIYRRTIEEMPADAEEIHALLAEGIEIKELTHPIAVVSENGKAKGLQCIKMELGPEDASGRPKPVPIANSEYFEPFDTIIPAIGQDVVIDFIDNNNFKYDLSSQETNISNVFIGGDAFRGAATIVKAVADGRKFAEKIIKRRGIIFEHLDLTKKEISYDELMIKKSKRIKSNVPAINYDKENRNFNILENSLNKVVAIQEANRCLYCDKLCNICVTVCPNRANVAYQIKPVKLKLNKVIVEANGFKTAPDKIFEINQQYQVLNIGDFCNECGNCTTFCPTSGQPYADKPKFYLTTESFNSVNDGYFMSIRADKKVLIQKEKDSIKTLTQTNGYLLYETDHITAKLNPNDFTVIDVKCYTPCVKEFHLFNAAELWILLNAIAAYYPNN